MTKRRSRKEKVKESAEEENGVDSQDVKTDEESLSEPNEPKRRKSEKRKSASPKKSKKEEPVEQEEKNETKDDTTDEEEDDTQYEVEEIIDEKMVKGVRHYLIRWKGYDEDGDTWEPESTLDCPDLIKKFKEQKESNGNESPKKGKKGKGAADDADADTPKKSKKENSKSAKKDKKAKKEEGKGTKKKSLPNVDWESDDEFEVDRILDVYFKKNGKREFLVSWKGYPNSQDSWEPEENLDCTDLIHRFMSKVEQAKSVEQKELRLNRKVTERFTLNMHSGDGSRRLSRRLGSSQRVHYYDAE